MQPLISCLCVTKNRPTFLSGAIQCFLSQSWRNKELIVVYEKSDIATKTVLDQYGIRGIEIAEHENFNLGELRNIAIQQSTGEYFCQWDDDDWYHNDRLTIQMNAIVSSGQKACTLTNWILFDEATSKAYFSMFRLWEGSIVCRRDLISDGLSYPSCGVGEDTFFLNELVKSHGIYPVVSPNLYIYRVHANNTWGTFSGHFHMMYAQAQALPDALSKIVNDIMSYRYTNEEASALLDTKEFTSQLHYFHFNNLNYSNEQVLRYMESVKELDVSSFKKDIHNAPSEQDCPSSQATLITS
ncbi:glycosyltransferase family 2 protein [Teredinibacter purpureus]|uniref:glycosyltransferase family 2 protein n=1 Tax=Teredinibacter purpureus TaxID=2731756 RepID=UPI0005F837E1|nr:glycosyltransferase family A protein [Teredinibacter purpureus]